jgi:hypothetical protein
MGGGDEAIDMVAYVTEGTIVGDVARFDHGLLLSDLDGILCAIGIERVEYSAGLVTKQTTLKNIPMLCLFSNHSDTTMCCQWIIEILSTTFFLVR